MYKQSSGRNNRSKGFKIKHVIQLFVLVAICIWLIYQVKHSHDKKREFEEKNNKITSSLSNGAGDEVIKFGRKDVQPRYEKMTIVTDEKVEEAEDEEAEGGGGGQEDNKNEEDEREEDIKHEEKDDEVRGGGDDEIDENDQHKYDMELEHEGNLIDEKDAEGKDSQERVEEEAEGKDSQERVEEEFEGKDSQERVEEEAEGKDSQEEVEEEEERPERENLEEGERERENSGEGQREREEEDHEAREEHYKADDASSAVAHEIESVSLEKLNENSGTEEERSKNAEEFSAQGNQTVGNDIHQNVFAANERSSLNSTMKVEEKNSEPEEGNDPIETSRENSGALLNQIQEDENEDVGLLSGDGKKTDLKATNNFTTQLEEEHKPQVTSQNIVNESTTEVNTTTGAELLHSEVVESGKEEDPKADSLLSDPIDSSDSSSSNLQESSSSAAALHDHVGVDNDDIRRTMEGHSDEQDATATM